MRALMNTESFPQLALREFSRLKRLADAALKQIDDRDFTRAPGHDNSVAVMVKHLAGNMRSRWRDFLSTDGEKPDRHRDQEFEITDQDTRSRLIARWDEAWNLLFDALRSLSDDDLDRTITIRGEPLTVVQAIHRQLTHYAYHVGQIVFLAKHFAGARWKSLSIPKGESETFNRRPKSYIDETKC